jgi:hypothetical protein
MDGKESENLYRSWIYGFAPEADKFSRLQIAPMLDASHLHESEITLHGTVCRASNSSAWGRGL